MSIEQIKADYHLFLDIQIGKYFKLAKRSDFKSDAEAKIVLRVIIDTYNSQIASQHLRLDNSSTEAKTAWFNSVEIEFKNINNKVDQYSKEYDITLDRYDNQFDFLPPGAITKLMFAGPALEAYGYNFQRFKEVLDGSPVSDIEKHILLWAYNLVSEVFLSYNSKNIKKKGHHIANATSICMEELDTNKADSVVQEIYSNIAK